MNGDQPAFPGYSPKGDIFDSGLTKREWLAGMALCGLLLAPDIEGAQRTAQSAVKYADALLTELEKPCE